MAGRHYLQADSQALADYAARAATLAEDTHRLAGTHLAGNTAVPEDCFGDVGREAGVHTALSAHIGALHEQVRGTAGTVAELGTAVSVAHTDYAVDEQDKADQFRRLHG